MTATRCVQVTLGLQLANMKEESCYLILKDSLVEIFLIKHFFIGGVYLNFLEYGIFYPKIGPSGVRALPLAAGINVGGHYKGHFFLLSPLSLQLIANSPRRSYRRVLKFCMGS